MFLSHSIITAYIDPGTGGMIFSVLFGLFGSMMLFIRAYWVKLKYRIGVGKMEKTLDERIPVVIFSDHKRYWNIFEPICDRLEKKGIKCAYYTMSDDDPALEKKYENITAEFIGEGNRAFARMNLVNAVIVLSTTPSLDVFQWKRSKNAQYYIHIPHASSDITLYRMFGIDFYDAILLSGDYQKDQIRELERLRNEPAKDIEIVGIPYMDVMADRIKKAKESSEVKTNASDKKTVLLAPSWGKSGALSMYGEKLIDALLKTGYDVIIRPHPQSFASEKELMDKLMNKYGEGSGVTWNRDNDNFDVLMKSDIMISDFSGVIFDFTLVYDKPVIYTGAEMDKAPYDASWIDDELWTIKILPSIGRKLEEKDLDNMKAVIDECLECTEYSEGRDRARKETWAHYGEGAERAADYVAMKYKELVSKDEKPSDMKEPA